MSRVKYIFTALFLLLIPALLEGQDGKEEPFANLPELKDDASFIQGSFANGINYCFAENNTDKGMMNISLVQKMDSSIDEQELMNIAREGFSKVDFVSPSFNGFLSRHGIYPSADGYVSVCKGALHFNIERLSSAMNENVLDSTFISIFELASILSAKGTDSKSQLLMISGDVDSKTMIGRLKLLSLFIPRKNGDVPELEYSWDSTKVSNAYFKVNHHHGISEITVGRKEARPPKQYMKTVLPVISDKLANEFGWLVEKRLVSAFSSRKMAISTEFQHITACDGPYDEEIMLNIVCPSADTATVKTILMDELTRLYTWGLNDEEYACVENSYKYRWMQQAKTYIKDNSELQKTGKAAWLYNGSLANDISKIDFVYRDMSLEVKTRLFNNYMSRLLEKLCTKNPYLPRSLQSVSNSRVQTCIDSHADVPAMKAPKDKDEYMTGGKIWTFANNVNIIHKKMDTKGLAYYSYAVKGSRQDTDIDNFASIDGLPDDIFSNYLASTGIEMKVNLQPADVRLEGCVIEENLEQLIKILVAFSAQKENTGCLGANNYKLLVIVSDYTDEQIKTLASKYVYGLRPGVKWKATMESDDSWDRDLNLRGFLTQEKFFTIDRTVNNEAVADVASYALLGALAKEFDGCDVYPGNWSAFVGTEGKYHLIYGVHSFNSVKDNPYFTINGEKELKFRLSKVLWQLSGKMISKEELEEYKLRAANAHESRSKTPSFIIDLAVNRYVANKDFSRYASRVNLVTAEQIQNFYATATSSN
ncbi:MAG: hypothetical protein MJY92_01515 [Bacteroidales bacterium]|nr:hypothetical protein [Bacteroidales bacterium]